MQCSRSLMCHLRADEDLYRELSTKLKPQVGHSQGHGSNGVPRLQMF